MKKSTEAGNPKDAVTFSIRLWRAHRAAIFAAAANAHMSHPEWIMKRLLSAAKAEGVVVPEMPDYHRRKYNDRARQEEVARETGISREALREQADAVVAAFYDRLLADSRKRKR